MKILVFGEILYDVYDGLYTIGGAPFNFAIQLARMSAQKEAIKMISGLGQDELGLKALEFAQKEGLDTSCMQLFKEFRTGEALVFLDENKIPDYKFLENAAWDNIKIDENIEKALLVAYDAFYFNLLVQRFNPSAQTLKSMMQKIKAKFKIFDMTLRKQYFTKEKLELALNFINVLKVNEEELLLIQELFYPNLQTDEQSFLALLQKDFNINYIFLTLGEKGACLQSLRGFFYQEAQKDLKVVDTLGAGDSFCAALTYGLIHALEDKKILSLATEVAGILTTLKGGTAFFDFNELKNKYFKGA